MTLFLLKYHYSLIIEGMLESGDITQKNVKKCGQSVFEITRRKFAAESK